MMRWSIHFLSESDFLPSCLQRLSSSELHQWLVLSSITVAEINSKAVAGSHLSTCAAKAALSVTTAWRTSCNEKSHQTSHAPLGEAGLMAWSERSHIPEGDRSCERQEEFWWVPGALSISLGRQVKLPTGGFNPCRRGCRKKASHFLILGVSLYTPKSTFYELPDGSNRHKA